MIKKYIVLFAIIAVAAAEIAKFKKCKNLSEDACKINEVRITPCEGGSKCTLTLGNNASLSFDFTPEFASSNMKTAVYWMHNNEDKEFTGMADNNACLYTTCPTEPGKMQTFNYQLYVGKKLPKGTYPIKWKIENNDNPSEVCCWTGKLKLKPENE